MKKNAFSLKTRYCINWSLAMLLGMYTITGYIMPVSSLLAFVTTSPDTPCVSSNHNYLVQ